MFNSSQWSLFIKRLAKISRLALFVYFKRNLSGPKRLRIFFERAGGAFIKFGQILALRQDFLPFSYTIELFKLLNDVKEAPFEEIQAVFAEEKGLPIDAFFSEFNPKPIASASIGQVYEAWLKGSPEREARGLKVAVKIQRPEVKKIFEADFMLASFVAGIFDFFRIFSAIKAQEVAADFISWTRREIDFTFEAENAAILYEHSRNHPQTIIPKQYPELSTSRVLIQEYIEGGMSVGDVIFNKVNEEDFLKNDINRDEMAVHLIIDEMRQYFIDGFFHADPHPANLLFLPGNKLVYFDFGIVGRADTHRLLFLKILYGVAKKDIDFISRQFMKFGHEVISKEMESYLQMDLENRKAAERIFEKVEELILEDFKDEMREIMNPWFEAVGAPHSLLSAKSPANPFFKILRKAEQYGTRLPREIILFSRAFSILDMLALQISRDFDMIKALNLFFEKYPLEEVELMTQQGSHDEEAGKKIIPLTNVDWEFFKEISLLEKERMLAARERIFDLITHYAEKYEEIRSMLKFLK